MRKVLSILLLIFVFSCVGFCSGNDQYTKLLLHCNGVDEFTTFTDESASAHGNATVVGTAQVDTAQYKWIASLLGDGNSDYIYYADNADWAFGSGDFCIDLWIRFASVASRVCFVSQNYEDIDNSFHFYFDPGGGGLFTFRYSTDGTTETTVSNAWSPSIDTWYHVAVTRNGADLRLFIGGVQQGATHDISTSTLHDSDEPLRIGAHKDSGATIGEWLNGWQDEIRISKGHYRWNSNFTPSTSEYTDSVLVDPFEYSTDALAQAAYVSSDLGYTSDLIPTMTSNTTPSGAASADSIFSATFEAWKAMNDTNSGELDCWHSEAAVAFPHYLQYQFTTAKVIQKYTISARDTANLHYPSNWTLQGSNNGSDWDVLDTQTSQSFSQAEKKTYTFANSTPYIYYKLNITVGENGLVVSVGEFELMQQHLQCFSEDTIKQQGSYSIKVVAAKTGSLNDTLTRTVSPTIDLSGKAQIKYYIYSASRTGSNIKISIHDSGGITTEHTANISATEAWETQSWNISGVSNSNKDAIDQIKITVLNADTDNTFYLDNMYGTGGAVTHPATDQLLLGGMWFRDGKLQYSDWCRFKRGTSE